MPCERLPHDFQRRVAARPEREGRRALVEKHPEAIAPLRARRLDLLPEFLATGAVDRVEDQQAGGQNPGGKDGRRLRIESRRGGVDDEIDLAQRRRQFRLIPADGAEILRRAGQRPGRRTARSNGRVIPARAGHRDWPRSAPDISPGSPASPGPGPRRRCRAAGCATRPGPRPEGVPQRAAPADAVGVVARQHAALVHHGVDRPELLGRFGAAVAQLVHLHLVGNGAVPAAERHLPHPGHGLFEADVVHFDAIIARLEPGVIERGLLHHRRERVVDRAAQHGVRHRLGRQGKDIVGFQEKISFNPSSRACHAHLRRDQFRHESLSIQSQFDAKVEIWVPLPRSNRPSPNFPPVSLSNWSSGLMPNAIANGTGRSKLIQLRARLISCLKEVDEDIAQGRTRPADELLDDTQI